MKDRRRNLMMGDKTWNLLLKGTMVWNTYEGGYMSTGYVWTTIPLSDFVGNSSKYLFKLTETYLDSFIEMTMEIVKRSGNITESDGCELAITSSPLTPPSPTQTGESWITVSGEEALQSNGIIKTSNMTNSTLGWYLSSEGMAEAEWVWNFFPEGGGGGGAGDADNCPSGGNHDWTAMEQTGSVNCPYYGELTSCTRYQCRKCGANDYVYHCGHG